MAKEIIGRKEGGKVTMSLTIKGFKEEYTTLFEELAVAAIHEKNGQHKKCLSKIVECANIIDKKYRELVCKGV